MVWNQVYDPFHNMWLSTLVAPIPIVVLLVTVQAYLWPFTLLEH